MRNSVITQQGVRAFQGISKGIEPEDIPNGRLLDGRNMVCNDKLGEVRVRDGYLPVDHTIYNSAFKIMPGARGLLYAPPALGSEPDDPEGFQLKLGASPNDGLFISDDHDTQAVTFYVYGGDAVGITTYAWSFGDGDTSSGSSTSVSHNYTEAGTVRVTVTGTGSDSIVYSDHLDLVIERQYGEDTEVTASVTADGQDGSLSITEAGDVTIAWHCSNATSVTLNISTEGAAASYSESVSANGSRLLSLTGPAFVTIDASNDLGDVAYDDVSIEIVPEDPSGITLTLTADGYADYLELLEAKVVSIVWIVEGADTATLYIDGETISRTETLDIDPETGVGQGTASLNVTESCQVRLVAETEAGLSETTSVSIALRQDEQQPDRAEEIRIVGPTTASHGDTVALEYQVWGRLAETDSLSPWPLEDADISAAQTGGTIGDLSYSESLDLLGTYKVTGGEVTLSLPTGVNSATFVVGATLDGYPTVTGTHTITVTRPTVEIDVDVVDSDGADVTEVYVVDSYGAEVYLYLTAQHAGTSALKADFASPVDLDVEMYEDAPEGAWTEPIVTFDGYMPGHTDTTTPGFFQEMDGNTIPASAWENGKATVKLSVNMPITTPSYPTFQLYQMWRITGEVQNG